VPQGDTRSYQYFKLPNGMSVTNVHEPEATLAAAAVAVDAGSADNPINLPGLAHFCEHMLFLGTKRYPAPNGFDEFVGEAGGHNNALTGDERTVYFADVSAAREDELLSRFSDFFRAPLFSRKYVDKELQSIESEHAKNLKDQGRRIIEVFGAVTTPNSPMGRFKTGNLETLSTEPKKKGLDPVKELESWYKDHYCPHRMSLVTFGPASLDEQLLKAHQEFGDIPKGSAKCQEKRAKIGIAPPWPGQKENGDESKRVLKHWVGIQGITPQFALWMHFPLPDIQKAYKTNPLSYISYCLSYGGEHSLTNTLRDTMALASSISVSGQSSSAGHDYFITVQLTLKGRQHYEIVMDVIFQFLARMKAHGIDEELYQSLADVAKLEWDWRQPSEPMPTVSSMSQFMFNLPPEDLISGSGRIDNPNSTQVMDLLSMLRPDNMNLALVDPKANESLFLGKNVSVLPHYQAEYVVGEIEELLPGASARWTKWLHPGSNETDAIMRSTEGEIRGAERALRQAGGSSEFAMPKVPTGLKNVPKDLNLDNALATKSNSSNEVERLYGVRPTSLTSMLPTRPSSPTSSTAAVGSRSRRGWLGTWTTSCLVLPIPLRLLWM
jgi:secreted Zn-dependent insulinase-like peptidase